MSNTVDLNDDYFDLGDYSQPPVEQKRKEPVDYYVEDRTEEEILYGSKKQEAPRNDYKPESKDEMKFNEMKRLNKNGKDKDKIIKEYGFWNDYLEINYTKTGSVNEDGTAKLIPVLKPNMANIAIVLKNHPNFIKYKPCASSFYQKTFLGKDEIEENTIAHLCANDLRNFFGTSIHMTDVKSAIQACLNDNTRNELKEAFERLKREGVKPSKYFDNWLVSIYGCEDTKLNAAIGRKWLISGAARAMKPGCHYEGMLILQGTGGCGKTYGFEILANALNPQFELNNNNWHSRANLKVQDTKEIIEKLSAKFILEMEEMKVNDHNSANAMKGFVTETSDKARGAYKEYAKEIKRCWIIAGSSNDMQFISDTSESTRRWWCASIPGKVNLELLKQEAKGLWVAALEAYLNGEIWTLNDEERLELDISNEKYRIQSNGDLFLNEIMNSIPNGVKAIAKTDLVSELEKRGQRISVGTVANILKRLGWADPNKKVRPWSDIFDANSDKKDNATSVWQRV